MSVPGRRLTAVDMTRSPPRSHPSPPGRAKGVENRGEASRTRVGRDSMRPRCDLERSGVAGRARRLLDGGCFDCTVAAGALERAHRAGGHQRVLDASCRLRLGYPAIGDELLQNDISRPAWQAAMLRNLPGGGAHQRSHRLQHESLPLGGALHGAALRSRLRARLGASRRGRRRRRVVRRRRVPGRYYNHPRVADAGAQRRGGRLTRGRRRLPSGLGGARLAALPRLAHLTGLGGLP